MDFNEEDRIDKEIDMDTEYDMMPMPGGVPVPGIMPVEMPLNMQGSMGMQGFMPLMMKPVGVEMSPIMMPNINSNMMPNMIPNMIPSMMNVEQMLPTTTAGMNMMEQDEYEDMDEDMTRKKEYGPKEINKILMKMEKYNPGIFRYLRMYGVPFTIAKKIIRRIIKVTLMYYED